MFWRECWVVLYCICIVLCCELGMISCGLNVLEDCVLSCVVRYVSHVLWILGMTVCVWWCILKGVSCSSLMFWKIVCRDGWWMFVICLITVFVKQRINDDIMLFIDLFIVLAAVQYSRIYNARLVIWNDLNILYDYCAIALSLHQTRTSRYMTASIPNGKSTCQQTHHKRV